MNPYERFNWDSPILVSHHNPKTFILVHNAFGNQTIVEIAGFLFPEI